MTNLAVNHFGWLHDSIIKSIAYSVAENGDRELALHMDCPSDCGFEPWEGKSLSLLVSDISLMVHTVFGTQTGTESLNFVESGLSDLTRAKLRAFEDRGLRIGPEAYTMVFHSGSTMELICRGISVQLQP